METDKAVAVYLANLTALGMIDWDNEGDTFTLTQKGEERARAIIAELSREDMLLVAISIKNANAAYEEEFGNEP